MAICCKKTGNEEPEGVRARVPSFDGWDGLELDYAVPWPLGLILTKNTIARYNKLFQYLLRLKRAQLALDDAWCRLRRKGGGDAPGGSDADRRVQADHVFYGEGVRGGSRGRGRGERGGAFEACQRVRHDIAFLVNNWTTYLQVDVIESQFRRAATRIPLFRARIARTVTRSRPRRRGSAPRRARSSVQTAP